MIILHIFLTLLGYSILEKSVQYLFYLNYRDNQISNFN